MRAVHRGLPFRSLRTLISSRKPALGPVTLRRLTGAMTIRTIHEVPERCHETGLIKLSLAYLEALNMHTSLANLARMY